jgi:hypothetical protein
MRNWPLPLTRPLVADPEELLELELDELLDEELVDELLLEVEPPVLVLEDEELEELVEPVVELELELLLELPPLLLPTHAGATKLPS